MASRGIDRFWRVAAALTNSSSLLCPLLLVAFMLLLHRRRTVMCQRYSRSACCLSLWAPDAHRGPTYLRIFCAVYPWSFHQRFERLHTVSLLSETKSSACYSAPFPLGWRSPTTTFKFSQQERGLTSARLLTKRDAMCTTSSTAVGFSLGVSVCQARNMLRRSRRTVYPRGSSSLELGMGIRGV